jgi:hypothetical protein
MGPTLCSVVGVVAITVVFSPVISHQADSGSLVASWGGDVRTIALHYRIWVYDINMWI